MLSTPPAFILSQDQTLMFKCLIPFRTTLGCSFRLLLSFPILRIGKGLNFVLYEPSFQTLIKCFAFNLTHKRISRLLHMFFKELLHVCILFSYQCSLVLLITHSRQLLYNIMCCFLCQQLFSTFFNSFSLFQRRPLKLAVFQLFVVAVFSNLG